MCALSVISFLLLGGYLLAVGKRHGIPDMVSDTFYQLKGRGWIFSIVMVAVAVMMAMCLLDSGRGIQPLAFLGCVGLMFVGCAPCYLNKEQYRIHKTAAVIAAVGCVGWCVSVCWWITAIIAVFYMTYILLTDVFKLFNEIWYISKNTKFHHWYWAEVAGFTDVFLTYWLI